MYKKGLVIPANAAGDKIVFVGRSAWGGFRQGEGSSGGQAWVAPPRLANGRQLGGKVGSRGSMTQAGAGARES